MLQLHPRRPGLRPQAWIAIAVLLLGMLAPSISAALSHVRGDSRWQDICSSSARSGGATGGADSAALDMLLAGHCALCHLHASDVALPPAPPATLTLRGDLAFAMPERFYSAPATPHAWRAAPARAPPLST